MEFKVLFIEFTDYLYRAPRAAVKLLKFGMVSGTPFVRFSRSYRVIVAGTVAKGDPLTPSSEMAKDSSESAPHASVPHADANVAPRRIREWI